MSRGAGAGSSWGEPDRRTTMALQAQINRFVTPHVRVTGTLDPATAGHAVGLMIGRAMQGFVSNSQAAVDAEALRQFQEAGQHLANPMPYVAANLESIVGVLKDYGDYRGLPPATIQGSPIDKRVLAVAAVLGVGAFVFFGGRR